MARTASKESPPPSASSPLNRSARAGLAKPGKFSVLASSSPRWSAPSVPEAGTVQRRARRWPIRATSQADDGAPARLPTRPIQASDSSCAKPSSATLGTFGIYEDELLRVNGRWLFSLRRILNEFLPGRESGSTNPVLAMDRKAQAFATYGVMPTVNLVGIYAVRNGLANSGAGRFFTTTPENAGWQK